MREREKSERSERESFIWNCFLVRGHQRQLGRLAPRRSAALCCARGLEGEFSLTPYTKKQVWVH